MTVLALCAPAGSAVAAPGRSGRPTEIQFRHLVPGAVASLYERVPVNVVFVGFDDKVSVRGFRAGLPDSAEPLVQVPLLYGLRQSLGIRYTYDYHLAKAPRRWEDAFFAMLSRVGRNAPLSAAQQDYNAQQGKAREVRDNVDIDAPTVERWLAAHAPRGIDTAAPTFFLINWYGRRDFRYHVYTKTNEPDPDTESNFGTTDYHEVTAWGGTAARDPQDGSGVTRRVWFYDLSAGPDYFAGNFDVDHADLDGDGAADYRIPPAWEYGSYRPRSALTADLAKLTRYVAIDAMVTASPAYDPGLPSPLPPRTINIDDNVYRSGPDALDPARYLRPTFVVDKLSALRPRNVFSYDSQRVPFTGQAKECFDSWVADSSSCLAEYDLPPAANLFTYATENLDSFLDDEGAVDSEIPTFSYSVDDSRAAGLLGTADDNWVDGTQSYIFTFLTPAYRDLGYGFSATLVHEVGHYLGLGHPHDGYDSASGAAFGPSGDFYFTWVGSESNSVMSYIDLNWDFSQFDLDNSNRWLTAVSESAANRVLAAVLAHPDRGRAVAQLRAADRLSGAADRAFARHRYALAYELADRSYQQVLEAARIVGIDPAAAVDIASRSRVAPTAPAEHPTITVDAVRRRPGLR